MLMRRVLRFLLLVALLTGAAAPSRAELRQDGKRVALVIGNGEYRNVDHLPNAANDAKLIAETLRGLGFAIVGGGARLDLDREHLSNAVREFGQALAGAEVGLFYYSGHGLQVRGVNWLVPVDASPATEHDLDFQMVDADLVLRQMDGVGTKLNIVLLDACRNNPFAIRGLRALQAGLAEMRAPEGTLISYATQPGNVAVDGSGANSPYTEALASSMRQPGVDIFRLFNQVGLQVKKTTDGRQQPWVSTSPIDGDFYFTRPPPQPLQTALVVPPAPAPAQVPAPVASGGLIRPPKPGPEPSPDDVVRNLVNAQACSILEVRKEADEIQVVGMARAGPGWDNLLRQIRVTRSIRLGTPLVEFLPPFACEVVDVLGPPIREARQTEGRLIVPLPPGTVTGTALSVVLRRAAGAAVVLDVFEPGGTVRHLVTRPAGQNGDELRFSATLAKPLNGGQYLLTALLSVAPLALGDRPEVERSSAYLAAVGQVLRTAGPIRSDMTVFEARAVAPVANAGKDRIRPAPRASAPTAIADAPASHPARCGAILERAQLGETASDSDRAFLRAACH